MYPLIASAQEEAVPGEVLVEFNSEPSAALWGSHRLSSAPIAGAELKESLSADLSAARVAVAPEMASPMRLFSVSSVQEAKDACAALQLQNPGVVRYCSPNYILHVGTTPNDSRYGELWGMSSSDGIDAPRAWSITTGSSDEVVGVIDTGIDYTHPDLAANVWSNPREVSGNGIDDDNNGYVDDVHGINAATNSGNPMDDNGHGTHVSGTIAAVGNNSNGVVGVNWNTKVVGAKFLSASGSGTLSDAIKAINYMVDLKNSGVNIRVINNSWGGGGYSAVLNSAIERANDAGLIFVAAAGNESNDNDANPQYPSGYEMPNVVSVAAVDQEGNVASFSNYGTNTVDIAAPGVGILSTVPGGGYARYSGTSMATPHVAGALALLLGNEPGLTAAQAIARLYDSGKPMATLTGAVRTGRMLNLGRLISGDTSPIPPPPQAGPGCKYTVTEISDAPDTSADDAPVVINADDGNYYTVSLPFTVPWDGGEVSSVTISPNGVAYMGTTPSGNDYLAGPVAPRNSIAVLHADLYPKGPGYGVKVAVGGNSVTINWTTTSYALKSGVAIIRLTIHSDGTVQTWYDFQDSTLEESLSNTATVGLRGASASSATTFSAAQGKVHSGLALEYVPQCDETPSLQVQSINLTGLSNGLPTSRLEPGKQLALALRGNGSGAVSLQLSIEKFICKELAVKSMSEGALSLVGRVPRTLERSRYVQVAVVGTQLKSRLSIKKPRYSRMSSRRLSRKELTSACTAMVRSLR
jgi:subtilisin family serine protease